MPFIVKNTTLPSPLDLLAPHYCRGCGRIGVPFCECCKKNILSRNFTLCPNCKSAQQNHRCPNCPELPPIYAVGERSGLLNQVIHDYKYHSIRALAKPLAEILNTTLPPPPTNTILVPLPTSAKHLRTRGFDHTLLITKHLGKLRHLKTQQLLTRTNNTTQVGTNRATRLAQAETTYQINPRIHIDATATYLLFDDIWTTGASMKSAIKKLRTAGVSQIIVALLAISCLD